LTPRSSFQAAIDVRKRPMMAENIIGQMVGPLRGDQ
jgi:hypothetical protein